MFKSWSSKIFKHQFIRDLFCFSTTKGSKLSNNKLNKIISMDIGELKNSLKKSDISICVIGIGRIGLPSALSFANSGLQTIGVDINTQLVSQITSGDYPLKDEPGFDKIFSDVLNKTFSATTDIAEVVPKSDVVLLSLPTPMDKNNIPDYSALTTVGKSLSKLLPSGSLVVVESTVEPGFIENELTSIIENGSKKVGIDFSIATAPETANPGFILEDFANVPRLVGGIDEKTANIVAELYKHVFTAEIILMPDCKTANASKLTANVFRDINIAFVNELAILFENLGIDILTVLKACKKKYNFQIHYPGAGVGGPCLPVNSYQLLNSAKRLPLTGLLKIIEVSRKINESMPNHTVDLLSHALNEVGRSIKDSTIVILGVSYKPNIKDIQLSPAEHIVKKLDSLHARTKIYDPYFKSSEVYSHKTENDLLEAITDADAVIIVTGHKEFYDIDPTLYVAKMRNPVIVDTRGVIDMPIAKKAGLVYRGIGRGFNSQN